VARKSTKKKPTLEEVTQQTFELVELADSGDAAAMSEIRQWTAQIPSVISLLGGNLAAVATESLIDAMTGKQLVWREAILQHLDRMRVELAGPNLSAIEKLVVDRVIACWLQVYHADLIAAQAGTVSLQQGDYLQRRQDRAHNRFNAAVKSLATVRRLALPIRVQLNVAASIKTKPAEPTHPVLPNWDRGSLSN